MKKLYMTSDDLIASIKRRGMIPQHQVTFKAEDFLAFADEEMEMGVVPTIIKNHEDYLLYSQKIPLVSGQHRYTIPYRAIGNKLKDAAIVDDNGNYFELTRISLAQLSMYNSNSMPTPRAFYVENNQIVLVGTTIPFSGSIVMSYYMRPNKLVLLEQVAQISTINRVTGMIQLSNLPEEFTLSSQYDFICTKSPNKTLGFDLNLMSLNVTSKTINIDPTLIPQDLVPGDHLCVAGTSAIPQIPSDLHVYLAQRVVARCLEAIGDLEGLQAANAKVGELAAQTNILISSRVEDAPKKIVSKNGTLSRGRFFRRRRF